MRFGPEQMECFARLSHDRNPLHCDPAYAAATPFRRVVVHGVCGVLRALGQWAAGRPFALRRLRANFRRPLFLEEEYALAVTEAGAKVTLRWMAGAEVHADVSFTWEPWQPLHDDDVEESRGAFTPRADAREGRELGGKGALAYEVGGAGLALLPALGLERGQLPLPQLTALAGVSYLVGMEEPGRQALFAELDLSFAAGTGPTFCDLEASFDGRFNRVSISGRGRALKSFTLGALRRPEAGRGLEAVERVVGRSERWRGKTVLVTGSSRGFGAVLTRALAMQGANVVVHYTAREDLARRVADELSAVTSALLVRADLTRDEDCARLGRAVLERFGRLDLLVASAVPPIEKHEFLSRGTAALVDHVARSVAMAAGPLRALLPVLGGGTVLTVSSVYARDPPAGYAHYVAAKGALEGLTAALASEFPEVAFAVVRPPRLVPDDAGAAELSAATWAASSPVDVAAALLARLGSQVAGQCEVIDLE
jgi:NAD(P)-dependent dehydrogenase (short-subunit alcohol dehydrogenase family)